MQICFTFLMTMKNLMSKFKPFRRENGLERDIDFRVSGYAPRNCPKWLFGILMNGRSFQPAVTRKLRELKNPRDVRSFLYCFIYLKKNLPMRI